MTRRTMFLTLMLAWAPLPALVPLPGDTATGLFGVDALAAQNPADAAAEARIETALQRASRVGVPIDLLESKVREGNAKGVPMDRIADAVERRLQGLQRAQEAFSGIPDVGPGELDVGADALESGVSEAVLAELAGTAPRERRAAAIAALGYLVGESVAPREALDRVQEALARGPEELQNLPARAMEGRETQRAGGPEGGRPGGLPDPARIPAEVVPTGGVPGPGERPGNGPPDGPGY